MWRTVIAGLPDRHGVWSLAAVQLSPTRSRHGGLREGQWCLCLSRGHHFLNRTLRFMRQVREPRPLEHVNGDVEGRR